MSDLSTLNTLVHWFNQFKSTPIAAWSLENFLYFIGARSQEDARRVGCFLLDDIQRTALLEKCFQRCEVPSCPETHSMLFQLRQMMITPQFIPSNYVYSEIECANCGFLCHRIKSIEDVNLCRPAEPDIWMVNFRANIKNSIF